MTHKDLHKMTKAEIIENFKMLENHCRNQEEEINRLKLEQTEEIKRLKFKQEEEINRLKLKQTEDAANFNRIINELQSKLDARESGVFRSDYEALQKFTDRRVNELQDRREMVENLLKQLQGLLDNTITLHTLMLAKENE